MVRKGFFVEEGSEYAGQMTNYEAELMAMQRSLCSARMDGHPTVKRIVLLTDNTSAATTLFHQYKYLDHMQIVCTM